MRWFTAEAVAHLTGLKLSTVKIYMSNGTIPNAVQASVGYVVAPQDLATYLLATRSYRKIPYKDHIAITEEYATTDISLQKIADRYGVSREAVRLVVANTDPNASKKHQQVLDDLNSDRLTKKLVKRMKYAWENDMKCPVDGSWVLRGRNNLTCSPECSEAWLILRNIQDDEAHRLHRVQMAKTYLANPHKYKGSSIEWAHQMLSENPPPPNRRFLVPGSKRSEVIRKYRPELYAKLVGPQFLLLADGMRIGPFRYKREAQAFAALFLDGEWKAFKDFPDNTVSPLDYLKQNKIEVTNHERVTQKTGVKF